MPREALEQPQAQRLMARAAYYPGALLGGLPPQPWFWSDAPQLLAAVGGAIGMAVIARRLARPPTARLAGDS